MKTMYIVGLLVGLALAAGCTENSRTKSFGGSMIINVPAGKKVTNATWKDDNMWYFIRDRLTNEVPTTSEFIEKSRWGALEGKIIFIEQ